MPRSQSHKLQPGGEINYLSINYTFVLSTARYFIGIEAI